MAGQIIQDGSKDKDSGMDGFQDGDNKDGLNKAGTHWHGDLDGGKCGDKDGDRKHWFKETPFNKGSTNHLQIKTFLQTGHFQIYQTLIVPKTFKPGL